MERTSIATSKDSQTDLANVLTLGYILRTTAWSSVFALLLSEIHFMYLLYGGMSRFPEKIVVFILVSSIGYTLVSKFFNSETAALTLLTSFFSVIFISGWFFSESTDPFRTNVFDWVLIGLVGSVFLTFLVNYVKRFMHGVKGFGLENIVKSAKLKGTQVVKLFDTHPWIVSILLLIVGALIGYFARVFGG